jgi:hypothetical protein
MSVAAMAGAHVTLDSERVQELIREIVRHQAAAGKDRDGSGEVEALFRVGSAVDDLVDMLNQDLIAHGQGNLLAETLRQRLGESAITVTYSVREGRYVYDQAAYHEYLRRAPRGPRAASARFRVIARTFQATMGLDPGTLVDADLPALLRAIAAEERFLREHPDHEKAAEVRFFLAVDYYRAFRNAGDPARARQYRAKARQALEGLTKSPNVFEVRAAETLLEQLARSR